MGLSMLRGFVVFALCLAEPCLGADYLQTDCYGPKDATTKVVYMHGWDDPAIGAHERQNRAMWQRMAEKHGFRVALPRGDGRCNGGRRQCWQTHSKKQIEHSWERILAGAKACFPKPSGFGIVGFSNGGYLATGIYGLCLKPKPSFTIAAGSASLSFLGAKEYQDCGPFLFHTGKYDPSAQRMERFFKRLKAKNLPVSLVRYPGGHVLNEDELLKAIRGFGKP